MDRQSPATEGVRAASKAVNSCFLLLVWLTIMGLGLVCLWGVLTK